MRLEVSRRLKSALVLATASAFAAIAIFEPTRILRGLLFDEAFFRNRPTSYWREVFREDARDGKLSAELQQSFERTSLSFPVLFECSRDDDRGIRWTAFKLLQTCGTESQVESTFVEGLSDSDRDIQLLAIRGLTRIGSPATSALPALTKLLQSIDPVVVDSAAYAIWEIGPEQAAAAMNWTVTESDQLGFRAMFPSIPKEETTYQQLPLGESATTTFVAMCGINVFAVAVTKYPPEVGEAYSVEDRFESITEGLPKALGGDLEKSVDIEKQGHSGKEFVVTIQDRATIKSWNFIIDPYAYQLQIVRSHGGILHPNAEAYFFDSFEFIAKSAPK